MSDKILNRGAAILKKVLDEVNDYGDIPCEFFDVVEKK